MIIITPTIIFSVAPLLLIALALVFIPYISRISKLLTTIVHEVGHGIVAIPFGGRISHILLHSDGAGEAETKYSWFLYHPVRLISLLMGYGMPLYAGLALMIASYHSEPIVSLWILGVTGILTLFAIRNWMGLLIVSLYNTCVIVLVFLNFNYSDISAPVYVIGLVLILRGVIDILFAGKMVFFDGQEDTDFHIMEEEMFLPAVFWYVFFVIFHVIIISYLLITFFPIVVA